MQSARFQKRWLAGVEGDYDQEQDETSVVNENADEVIEPEQEPEEAADEISEAESQEPDAEQDAPSVVTETWADWVYNTLNWCFGDMKSIINNFSQTPGPYGNKNEDESLAAERKTDGGDMDLSYIMLRIPHFSI